MLQVDYEALIRRMRPEAEKGATASPPTLPLPKCLQSARHSPLPTLTFAARKVFYPTWLRTGYMDSPQAALRGSLNHMMTAMLGAIATRDDVERLHAGTHPWGALQ